MVINLTRLGAVVIAFDIMFAEPDRLNPEPRPTPSAISTRRPGTKLRALPSNDQILADAIKRSRVVLGETGLPQVVPELDKTLPVTGLAMLGEDPQPFMFEFPGLLRNVRVLEEAAAGRGLLTIRPERDGIVRRVPMMLQAQGAMMPSLSFEMLAGGDAAPTRSSSRPKRPASQSVGVKGFQIPTDRNGQLWVHFARHDPSIYVSAADVLDGNVPPEKINGKLVLIGTSAVGLNDIKTTPVSPAMPGVEIHAQVLEAALTKSLLSQPNYGLAAGIFRRDGARPAGDRIRADVRAGHPGRGRRAVCNVADRNVLVFLHAATAAGRFHLSAAVDHGDLSHPDFLQLRARAGAAQADPLGVRAVHVAGAGRAAGAIAGKTRARRRGARDDHHVLRRPRLHHHLGSPTSTIRRASPR